MSLRGGRERAQGLDLPLDTYLLLSMSGKCPRIPCYITLGDYCSTPAAVLEKKKKKQTFRMHHLCNAILSLRWLMSKDSSAVQSASSEV